MTFEENIQTALFTRVESLSISPSVPVSMPNIDFPSSGEVPETYIRVNHLPNDNQRFAAKNGGTNRFLGILQLTVVTPLGKGEALAVRIAGAIADHFSSGLALYSEGVKVTIMDRPSIAPGFKSDDVSWDVPVSIKYDAFA